VAKRQTQHPPAGAARPVASPRTMAPDDLAQALDRNINRLVFWATRQAVIASQSHHLTKGGPP
jgi:hypothetical protein